MIDLWPEESIENTFSLSLKSTDVEYRESKFMMMMMKFARNTNSMLASELSILDR